MAETVLNLIWIVLGVAIAAMAPRYTIMGAAGPGGGFVPLVTCAVVAGCGLILLLRSTPQPQGLWPASRAWLRMGLVVGGLAAITLLMPRLGFILTVLPIMAVLMQAVDRKSWWSRAWRRSASVSCSRVCWQRRCRAGRWVSEA